MYTIYLLSFFYPAHCFLSSALWYLWHSAFQRLLVTTNWQLRGWVSSLSTCHLPFGIWCQPPHPLPLLSTRLFWVSATWLSLFSPSLSIPSHCCSWRVHCYPPPSTKTLPLETSASQTLPLETRGLRSFSLAHMQLLNSKPVFNCSWAFPLLFFLFLYSDLTK